MKYYRYMSYYEFVTVLQGGTIESSGRCGSCRTTSDGVCFIGEHTDVMGCDFSPVDCFDFLKGIVSNDILVEFSSDEPLAIGYGTYATPEVLCHDYDDYFDGRVSIQEYYLDSYSRHTLTPVGFYTCETGPWTHHDLAGSVRIPVASDVYYCRA